VGLKILNLWEFVWEIEILNIHRLISSVVNLQLSVEKLQLPKIFVINVTYCPPYIFNSRRCCVSSQKQTFHDRRTKKHFEAYRLLLDGKIYIDTHPVTWRTFQ